jgi:hypothetical protein
MAATVTPLYVCRFAVQFASPSFDIIIADQLTELKMLRKLQGGQ